MKSRFLSFFLIAFCFFALNASAQVPISVGGLELSASTDNPIPGQTITITAKSYAIDISGAKISWTANGTSVKNGVGATTLDVTAPVLGKILLIKATATTPEGRVVAASIPIGSGSIDMIFESDGYVAPFFKGKISPVYQNSVKIVAMPHLANSNGVEYDPKTLIYQWKKNDRVLEDQSGYGKQSVTLVGDIVPRPYDLSVDVWPRDNSSHTQDVVEVSFGSPTINFYIDDPLYGPLFNRAVATAIRIGSQKETTVLAVPFGFNKTVTDETSALSWSWSINDSVRSELSSNESVVLRAPDNSTGSSNIQLNVTNTDKILQGVNDGFSASFSAEKATSTESLTF